jgi:diguanylate cyclase (GGDEF)-like protein
LYGISVVFCLTYTESAVIYGAFAAASIFFVGQSSIPFHAPIYGADIVSNIIIAMIIAAMNYRSFLRDFRNRKIIEKANSLLTDQNEHIRQMNQSLILLSERDPLTGLFNRRKLDELLDQEWKRYERYSSVFTIVLMDVDFFKQINDSFGHIVGDETLKSFTAVIQNQLRTADAVGRWGGEEFLVICRESGLLQGAQFASRLRECLSRTVFKTAGRVTASFGVATSAEVLSPDSLLVLADTRMYQAKNSGRNRVEAGIMTDRV